MIYSFQATKSATILPQAYPKALLPLIILLFLTSVCVTCAEIQLFVRLRNLTIYPLPFIKLFPLLVNEVHVFHCLSELSFFSLCLTSACIVLDRILYEFVLFNDIPIPYLPLILFLIRFSFTFRAILRWVCKFIAVSNVWKFCMIRSICSDCFSFSSSFSSSSESCGAFFYIIQDAWVVEF